MTPELQRAIAAARALPPRDKLELLGVILRDQQKIYTLLVPRTAHLAAHPCPTNS